MKPIKIALLLALGLLPAPALAQGLMFEYFTTISPNDTYNSRGESVGEFCLAVQQDRANVHRFGNPDGDVVDPFFTTQERRAMIAGRCDYVRDYHTLNRIRSRTIGFVLVRVYGTGGVVSRVQILEAAG